MTNMIKSLKLFFLLAAVYALVPVLLAAQNTMVLVEGGTFRMGSFDTVYCRGSQPVHSVTVSSFYMDAYKVTLEDWVFLMEEWTPCNYETVGIWKNDNPVPKSQWHEIAACGVSWYNALIYCNRKSEREGLTPCYASKGSKDAITYSPVFEPIYGGSFPDVTCDWNANGYRLPTEAEWEYAARGGKHKSPYKYSGSNNYKDVINQNKPYKLGIKKPNALGLYDMSSDRFSEWCWDFWSDTYYKESDGSTDPKGPLKGKSRVYHGFRKGGFEALESRDALQPDMGYLFCIMTLRLVRKVDPNAPALPPPSVKRKSSDTSAKTASTNSTESSTQTVNSKGAKSFISIGFSTPVHNMFRDKQMGFSFSWEDGNRYPKHIIGMIQADYFSYKDKAAMLIGGDMGYQFNKVFALYGGGGIGHSVPRVNLFDFTDFTGKRRFAWKVNGGLRTSFGKLSARCDVAYINGPGLALGVFIGIGF